MNKILLTIISSIFKNKMKNIILINFVIGLIYADSEWMSMTSEMPFMNYKYCSQWNSFLSLFNKNYSSPEEEQKRFIIFKNNFKLINEFNAGNHTFKMGINGFIDLVS